jgi:hypothetical protein
LKEKTVKPNACVFLLRLAIVAAVLLAAGPAAPQQIPRDGLAPRALPAKSLVAAIGRVEDPRTLIVKLADGEKIGVSGGRFVATAKEKAAGATAERLNAVFAQSSEFQIGRAITEPKPLLDAMREAGELATGEELADLSQFYIVRVPAGRGVGLLEDLLALDEVENAYAYRAMRHPADVAPATPDFLHNPPGQGYRGPAPAGIDIDAAWSRGLRGQGVTVVDVETNWNLNHEDLDHLATQVPAVPIIPQSDWRDPGAPDIDHGTASLGILAAGDNGYGTSGLVPSAKFRVVPIFRQSDLLWNAPNAVVAATLAMSRGDVMLLEVENPQGEPFETFDLEFAVVRQATALGIHVIEPAGNSPNGFSLDTSPLVSGKFDWRVRDSGAIVVAGGESAVTAAGLHYRYVNSNCGSRVDAFAWGQNITTLGYGAQSSTLSNCANPFNPFPAGSFDPNQLYTYCFNGTSGAGAIVAGAVAALEQKHMAKWGRPASPREMRNHLRLGTVGSSLLASQPAGSPICGGGIGHQPDMVYHLSLFEQGGIIAHTFNAELQLRQPSSIAKLGSAIASPGDVDGDGLADIAIGAPGYWVAGTPPLSYAGRVYLFSAKSEKILWTADGTASNDWFGQTLAALGDVDNDGIGDLAAVAPFQNGNLGAVRVLSGATGVTIYTLGGTTPYEAFGAAVAAVGDVDGDGVKDLVVGVPGSTGSGLTGRVEVHSGRTGTLLWSQTDNQVGSDYGFAVAGTGDMNGDGVADVIVGAPRYFDALTGKTPGAITILSGATGAPFFFLRGEIPLGTFNFSAFGSAVAGAGDLTGDGIADFVVGAPGWTQTVAGPGFGKVYIYSSNGVLLRSYTGAQKSEHLGRSVAGDFDWNGDGQRDVAAGQPGSLSSPGFPATAGKMFVYQGPFNAVASPGSTKVFPTKETGTSFGTAVAVLGDTNGDLRPDISAGEPDLATGRAFVFSSGPAPAVLQPKLVADVPAIEAFDVDGDGNGGGGLSPSRTFFHLDAGQAWAGANYQLVGVPRPPFATNPTAQALVASGSPYLIAASGTLDGTGQTSAPRFGPIPKTLLCPGLAGAEFDFVITVRLDTNGDGIYDQVATSNTATVTIIHEYYPIC